ncbi:MAG TPA: DUF5615 family PIN-like protein [Verrucomicrobiota bacterium]|nr:hypothetical protein [Verrucomicrobiales bacterium]HRI14937.1 DUF5615 family PIN-like protein [Verrucomicrobiota bacterium]
MRFLLDANLPRSTAALIRETGHEVSEVRECLPPGAPDEQAAQLARQEHRILVTRGFDFADIRNYPPHQYPGLIVLELPDDATARQVNQTIKAFLARSDWVAQLPRPTCHRRIMARAFPIGLNLSPRVFR